MRLLKYNEYGELTITRFNDNELPPYSILSHTWGAENEEVTFADLEKGEGKTKPGYEKIRFCGEQTRRDGLEYFWIDTCCIDKENHAELSLAINSMFRWYRNSARCYVYLSDVSSRSLEANPVCEPLESEFQKTGWFVWFWIFLGFDYLLRWYHGRIRRFFFLTDVSGPQECESLLQKSRWFTRGWTLQELLAPSRVEFFSREHKRLGDLISLTQQIHERTGIPTRALEGAPLSQFSDKERISWIQCRHTKIEEDKAYSLLGIFDVQMPLRYGEGSSNAFKRLEREIYMLNNCLRDLRPSDPRDDKRRIEETKGGLLLDSYRWILENTTFQQWQEDLHVRLLWVKGDPGKGKTMLLCGIIDELHNSMPETVLISYFFCQATDSRINSATAVLRGLLYMLVEQQPSLVSHVRKRHDSAGKTLFEDVNALVALTEIFIDVLQDPCLNITYLIIDALDECVTDRLKLLEFIAKHSYASSRVKWLVSSRNWPEIELQLEQAGHKKRLSLELNAKSVAAAVTIFVHQKVNNLAKKNNWRTETQHAVLQYLTSNANDTFLWVALVCQDLKVTANRHVLKRLAFFSPGLDALYKRMMSQLGGTDDAEVCRQVIASAAVLYRPVTILELVSIIEQLRDFADDLESVREIVSLCGSFLTVREDTVYFVHQSAKDFLFENAFNEVFPHGVEDVHHAIFSKSLTMLSRTLHRDMYNLKMMGISIDNIIRPDSDPLGASRYLCVYWIDHLYDSKHTFLAENHRKLQVGGVVDEFLRTKYLYWLEGLSLCKSLGRGVSSMAKLWSLMQDMQDQDKLTQLVQDARRFVMYHKGAIESYPLQAYASALLFSPTGSLIRQLWKQEEPEGIKIRPTMSDGWSACLQTLEGHNHYVTSVAFSHDSAQLASASRDKTVRLWDTSSGACLQTLEGHSHYVTSVAFSHNSVQLASASWDKTIKMWEASSGACLQNLDGHSNAVTSIAFSHDSAKLASASYDKTVKIWDASSGACLQTLEGHCHYVTSVAFSHDSAQLASASWDKTVKIWDMNNGACLQTLEGHRDYVTSVAFSHDSAQLASASEDKTVKMWDASSGACLQTLEGHCHYVTSVAFSHNSDQLVSASEDKTVKIWDTSSGACLQTLVGHSHYVTSVASWNDSAQLASASWDKTVKIWDASSSACLQTLKDHNDYVTSVALSRDSAQLVSSSYDKTAKMWDASSGACLQTFEGHSHYVTSVAFSHDSAKLASASWDKTVKIWDTSSGVCLQTLEGHSHYVTLVTFSHDSAQLASASNDKTVKIWDTSSGACLQTLDGHSNAVTSIAFSHDSARLASASYDNTVKIWDASSGACLQTLHIGKILYELSFNPNASHLYTDIGVVFIQSPEVHSTNDTEELKQSKYQDISLSADRLWIKHADQNVLWVPSEYRPSCSSVSGSTVAMGVGSGRVWSCKIDP